TVKLTEVSGERRVCELTSRRRGAHAAWSVGASRGFSRLLHSRRFSATRALGPPGAARQRLHPHILQKGTPSARAARKAKDVMWGKRQPGRRKGVSMAPRRRVRLGMQSEHSLGQDRKGKRFLWFGVSSAGRAGRPVGCALGRGAAPGGAHR